MLFKIIYYIAISLIIIGSSHYIYLYFKDNLTIPITKDLVKKPIEQYQEIYNVINTKKPNNFNYSAPTTQNAQSNENNQEKQELLDYLKSLNTENNAVSNSNINNIPNNITENNTNNNIKFPETNLSNNMDFAKNMVSDEFSKQQFPLSSNEIDNFTPY